MREMLEESGLGDMVEELFPYTAEFSHNLVTVIDPEDIKGTSFWSDRTLIESLYESRGKLYKKPLTKAE